MTRVAFAMVVIATLAMTGCGGGGGGGHEVPAPTPTPDPLASVELQLPQASSLDTPVGFSIVGGGTAALSYAWDFGDGETSSEARPAHDYRLPGAYTVRLRVAASSTASKELSRQIIVAPWSFLSGSDCSAREQGAWCLVPTADAGSLATMPTVAVFTDARTGWASAESEAVYRTIDGGISWNTSRLRHRVSGLAAVDAKTVWARSDSGPPRLSLSVDAGVSFVELDLPRLEGLSASGVQVLAGERLLLSFDKGRTLVSADRGKTWLPGTLDIWVTYQGDDASARGMELARTSLWQTGATGPSRSSDGGVSYQAVAQPPAACARGILTVVGNEHLVLDRRYDEPAGLPCVSRDGGSHWTVLPAFPDAAIRRVSVRDDGGYCSFASVASGQSEFLLSDASLSSWVAFPPFGPSSVQYVRVLDAQRALMSGKSLGNPAWTSVTVDGGQHWVSLEISSPEVRAAFGPKVLDLGGDTRFAMPNISRDGGKTWQRLEVKASSPPPVSAGLFVDARQGFAEFAYGNGLMSSQDGGRSWQAVPAFADAWLLALHRDAQDRVWVSSKDMKSNQFSLKYSSDRGATWQTAHEGSYQGQVALDFSRNDWWLAAGRGLELSTDGGKTWQFDGGPLASVVKVIDAQRGLAVFAADERGPCVRLTEDRGSRWSECRSLGGWQRVQAAASLGASVWLVAEGGRIRFSPDAGKSWSIQESGTVETLYDIRFATPKKGWIVGAGGLVLATEDGGLTWKPQARMTGRDLRRISIVGDKLGWILGDGVVLGTATAGE